jgi:hypothetical protein
MAYKAHTSLALSFFVVLYFLFRKVSLLVVRRQFSAKFGCKSAYQLPQSERIIGYSLFKEQLKAAKDQKMLGAMTNRYKKYGNTFTASMMGQDFIGTIEPENVKAILMTNFGEFGIRGRMESFGPLLGNGIFTSDGEQWEHSRVKQVFSRCEIYIYAQMYSLALRDKPWCAVLILQHAGTGSSQLRQSPLLQSRHFRNPYPGHDLLDTT